MHATHRYHAAAAHDSLEGPQLDAEQTADTTSQGLTSREAARRLVVYGPNELERRARRTWPHDLARQFTHPLALLLWGAAALAFVSGATVVGIAVVVVIVLNATLAFVQEQQAERSVEALRRYLPQQATVLRDGERTRVDAAVLVPGDVIVVGEGDRISADARVVAGSLEVEMSALNGESAPAYRDASDPGTDTPPLDAVNRIFSGTACTGGEGRAVVLATGMHTELGRIAALSQRTEQDPSPLEREVRRVAWIIAAVAVLTGVAFVPLGVLAGLPLAGAISFAIGLLLGNVPEGLLPTITLALAIGVRRLALSGALVKRLSAVETLGSTTVICTDKTGTLTENRMQATMVWTPDRSYPLPTALGDVARAAEDSPVARLAAAVAACTNAELDDDRATGDPTEVALLRVAAVRDLPTTRRQRDAARQHHFPFDPARKLMSTIDVTSEGLVVHTKGAPESVLARCSSIRTAEGVRPLDRTQRTVLARVVDDAARQGLRVLAVAERELRVTTDDRDAVESKLVLLGLVAMVDPPRPEVADAVARCHRAGVRIVVVTGDHALTATAISRAVGIVGEHPVVVTGEQLDRLSEADLDRLLRQPADLIIARASPEAKLRVTDALRAENEVVAMTGDGVNDAPALRRADIGVAMGQSGTDVAREAATMVLTDDDFATIVKAVEEGRRVFANVRKFVFYIFVHAVPEVLPLVVFALAGGAIPLPLTALLILAIDLGTETLPALGLAREPAEPGVMDRPPRRRTEGVISRELLFRAWAFLGVISALLAFGGFFLVLAQAGWRPGDATGPGTPLHDAYLEATTMTFLGIVACQIGTLFAARTDRASLRRVGVMTNPLVIVGIAFELAFAALVVAAPPLQAVFGTAIPPLTALLILPAFPLVVWGADELRRAALRHHEPGDQP